MPPIDKPYIDELKAQGDTDGLLEILRGAEDEDLRERVVHALVSIIIDMLMHTLDLTRDLAYKRVSALDHARDHALDLARVLDRTRDLAFALPRARDLARALTRARDLAYALDLARDLDRHLDRTRDLARALARALDLARALTRDRDLAHALARDLDLALDLADDLARDLAFAGVSDDDSVGRSVDVVIEHYQEELKNAHLSGDRPAVAKTLVFLGNEFAQRGSVDSAIAHYKEALTEFAGVMEREHAQQAQARIEVLKEYRRRSSGYVTSIKHPRRFSKRHSSKFKIFIYPSEDRAEVEKVLREAFDDEDWTGSVHPSKVKTGDLVVLKLWSAEIEFSGEVVKRIEHAVNQVTIGAKPKDTCHPGGHTVTLSISKKDTGEEISSIDFTVRVVDFAFDHVSRPLLSNVVSGVSGVFGAAAFVVTLLTDIDKALGLAAGTAALAVAAFIQARVWQLFRRPATTITP